MTTKRRQTSKADAGGFVGTDEDIYELSIGNTQP